MTHFDFIKSWYAMPEVKFEMIKFLYKREFAVLTPSWIKNDKPSTRMLKVHSVQHLDFNLKALRMIELKTLYNFYYSLAKYHEGIPNQRLNFSERDNTTWNKTHYEEMVSYDWLIDVDAGDHSDFNHAKESTIKIKAMLDNFNVPYELRFSGCGFHLIIPGKFIPKDNGFNPHTDRNIYKDLTIYTKQIYNKISEMVDFGIYDSRRICKLPYSLSIYKDKLYMCTPINSEEQLFNCQLADFEPCCWLGKIRGRGTVLFNPNGTTENIKKLFEELQSDKI